MFSKIDLSHTYIRDKRIKNKLYKLYYSMEFYYLIRSCSYYLIINIMFNLLIYNMFNKLLYIIDL